MGNAFGRRSRAHNRTGHDVSTIAAVIIEPVAGSTGVLVPPKGYLEKIRSICDEHGILLIFDEVITGFGRLGDPFAADYFGIVPDLMTTAKGLTNGSVPMSAVAVCSQIYDSFMQGPDHIIELFHGYTYSGHPLACAAALATLDVFAEDDLFNRSQTLAPIWESAIHSLKGLSNVIDIRKHWDDGRSRTDAATALQQLAHTPFIWLATKKAFSAPNWGYNCDVTAADRNQGPDRRNHLNPRRSNLRD